MTDSAPCAAFRDCEHPVAQEFAAARLAAGRHQADGVIACGQCWSFAAERWILGRSRHRTYRPT